ncbi:MAG: hypothetical protein WCG55_02010 [bacterium]
MLEKGLPDLKNSTPPIVNNPSSGEDAVSEIENQKIAKFALEFTHIFTTLEAKPEKISPTWLRENFESFRDNLIKILPRDGDKKIDWLPFISKLPLDIQSKWSYQERIFTTGDSSVRYSSEVGASIYNQRITQYADEFNNSFATIEAKPEKINPHWFRENYGSLRKKVVKFLPRKDGKIDWDSFTSKLSPDIQKRWDYQEKNLQIHELAENVRSLLEKNDVSSFSQGWILENDSPLYQRLLVALPRKNGVVDWDVLVFELPYKWQRRWNGREYGPATLERYMQPVLQKLESMNPEPSILNTAWLKAECGEVERQILNILPRNTKNEIQWDYFASLLPPKWQHKWIVSGKEFLPLEKCTERVNQILGSVNPKPEKINSNWLYVNDQAVFFKLVSSLPRNEDGTVNWQNFADQLSPEWKDKWIVDKDAIEYYIKKITAVLDSKYPETEKVSPGWLQDNLSPESQALGRLFKRSKLQTDWDIFSTQLPERWQKKWNWREKVKYSIEEIMTSVVALLEQRKPLNFGPNWIGLNMVALYSRMRTKFPKTKEGAIDWSFFVSKLPEKWQNRWRSEGEYLNIEEYSNEQELESCLEKYKESGKLYLIAYYSHLRDADKSDRDTANEMVSKLVDLAKKGNRNARETLEKDLSLLCEEWIHSDPKLAAWERSPKKLAERIKACIYCYDPKTSVPFFLYLRKSIYLEAKSFGKKGSFTRKHGDDLTNF